MQPVLLNSPSSFDELFDNMRRVITDDKTVLGRDFEVAEKKGDQRFLSSFDEVVAKTENLFNQFLQNEGFNLKQQEYLSAKLFTRLEILATVHYGLNHQQTRQALQKLDAVTVELLKQNLPKSTQFLDLAIEGKDSLDVHASSKKIGFYQESQQRIGTCLAHATNALLGRRAIDISAYIAQSENGGNDEVPFEQLSRLAHTNLYKLSVAEFFKQGLDRSKAAFFVAHNGHAYAYHRDQAGQWWRVDSYYKTNSKVYQIPVNLTEERAKLEKAIAYIVIDVESEAELKVLLREEFSKIPLPNVEVPLDKVEGALEELINKLPECALAKSNQFELKDLKLAHSLEESRAKIEKMKALINDLFDLCEEPSPNEAGIRGKLQELHLLKTEVLAFLG